LNNFSEFVLIKETIFIIRHQVTSIFQVQPRRDVTVTMVACLSAIDYFGGFFYTYVDYCGVLTADIRHPHVSCYGSE